MKKIIKLKIAGGLISVRLSDEYFVRVYDKRYTLKVYDLIMNLLENGYMLKSTVAYQELLEMVKEAV